MSDTLNSASGLRPVSDSISNGIKPEPASNDQKQGLSCSSQVVVGPIKKVDVGNSDACGDTAAASLATSAGRAPRAGMVQAPAGRNTPSNLPSTVSNWTGDADTRN